MTLRVGSLCSGVGMLDLAVESVLPGAQLAWYAQYEPPDKDGKPDRNQYAAQIMAHRFPGVPNHGDITAIDYAAVEPVDLLTAGWPCQDMSLAGKRAGLMPGTRSGLWIHVAGAIEALRPSLVLLENVRSLTSAKAHSDLEPCPGCMGDPGDGDAPVPHLRALGCVLGDLADLGFDAQWQVLPASHVGAPHKRERCFVLAWPADGCSRGSRWASAEDAHREPREQRRLAAPGQATLGRARPDLGGRGGAPASHAEGDRCGHAGAVVIGGLATAAVGDGAVTAADPAYLGHERDRDAWDWRPGPAHGCVAASDTDGRRRGGEGQQRGLGPARRGGQPPSDAERDGRGGWAEGGSCEAHPLRPGPRAEAAGSRTDTVADADLLGDFDSELPPGRDSIRRGLRADSARRGAVDAHSHGGRIREQPVAEPGSDRAPVPRLAGTDAPADPDSGRRGPVEHGDAEGQLDVAWGGYEPAIRRWEGVLGRPAPGPVDDHGRLAPPFVEWMMGLPAGWVTALPGIPRSAQLKALGNGVVPQQGACALRLLLAEYADAVAEVSGRAA